MTLDLAKLRAETLALLDGATPGPWFRDCWDVLGSSAGTGTGSICDVAHPNGDDDQYWKHGEADANARLIAAAPKLANDTLRLLDEIDRLINVLTGIADQKRSDEMSKELLEYADFQDGYDLIINEARAALAEGGPDAQ